MTNATSSRTIYLVRHGNYGRRPEDDFMIPVGDKDAQQAASWLQAEVGEIALSQAVILSSPVYRAAKTATKIASVLNLPQPHLVDRLGVIGQDPHRMQDLDTELARISVDVDLADMADRPNILVVHEELITHLSGQLSVEYGTVVPHTVM